MIVSVLDEVFLQDIRIILLLWLKILEIACSIPAVITFI